MTAPDQSTTAMHGLGSAEALARTWSDAARLVGVFGVQANGVTQIRMTPPWASTPAVFDLPGPGADA